MSIPKETHWESYYAILPTLTERQQTVLQILQECGGLTAQEISSELHRRGITPSDDRKIVAPRLAELAFLGLVKVEDKKKCIKTGRNVTVWSAIEENCTNEL